MYSLVLMMALSDGAALPALAPEDGVPMTRSSTHVLNRHGCCGGGHGCHGGRHRCHGCSGGCYSGGCCGGYSCGGYSCGGGYSGCGGGAAVVPVKKTPMKEKEKKEGEEGKEEISAPATIQVNLPADAKLSIDGARTSSTSASRTFVSPPLDQGKEYFYTLKAEVVRDGKTLSTERRISVRPGMETNVDLDFRDAQVASR